jgi:flagellar biosynthesis/type III secretory pathway protein FliH|tara:strand:+ start:1271 stop:1654 length:384 start_codon:yes stop_codon:yes gene_type:complete
MDQKKLEKLQKLFALASRNPNENEASVAALKFISALNKDALHITISEQPQPTGEQINKALQEHYQRGFQEGRASAYDDGYAAGYNKGIHENMQQETVREEQIYQPHSTAASTLYVHNTSGHTITVGL